MRVPVAPRRPLRRLLALSGGRPSRWKHSPQLHEWKSAPQVSESELLVRPLGVTAEHRRSPRPGPGARGERRPPSVPRPALPPPPRRPAAVPWSHGVGDDTAGKRLLRGLKFGDP